MTATEKKGMTAVRKGGNRTVACALGEHGLCRLFWRVQKMRERPEEKGPCSCYCHLEPAQDSEMPL